MSGFEVSIEFYVYYWQLAVAYFLLSVPFGRFIYRLTYEKQWDVSWLPALLCMPVWPIVAIYILLSCFNKDS